MLVLKADERCQSGGTVISGGTAISANFGCHLSAKVYASENPYKNGDFLVGF